MRTLRLNHVLIGLVLPLALGAGASCAAAPAATTPERPSAAPSAAPATSAAADAAVPVDQLAERSAPDGAGSGSSPADLGPDAKPAAPQPGPTIADAGPPPANPAPAGRRILGEPTAADRARLLSLLGSVCATREVTADGKRKRGCACCPPFEQCPPGAKLEPDDDQVYELRAAPRGSFTAPGKTEMAMTFWGCESHAENYGGTLVVTQSAQGWQQLAYRAGLNAVCEAYPRPGRNDLLLCLWADQHQGSAFYRVDVVDLSVPELEKGWKELVEARDNSIEACYAGVDDLPIVSHQIDHAELVDLDHDGKLDLVVPVRAQKGRATADYRAACTAAMEPTATKADDPARLLPKPVVVKLTFRFDGQSFVPMGITSAVQRWLHQENDAFLAAVN